LANRNVEMRQLRLLSWNIQWGRGCDGRVDLERLAAAAAAFQAKVICLQEVAVNHPSLPGGPQGSQPERLCALFPGFEAVYGVGSDLSDGGGGRRQFGQMILSRLPVLQVFRHLLPWPADPAVPSMQRVALEAVVDAPGGALRVVTTHLEYYSVRQRRAQVEALRAIHAAGWHHAQRMRSAAETDPPFAVLPRGRRTMLCGDFNFGPAAPEYRRLQRPFRGRDGAVPRLIDAWTLAHPGACHAPTAGVNGAPWIAAPDCYDFFFVDAELARQPCAMSVDVAATASDHQPVLLELSL
jgi:endonuclease/exonuclease/phosphatase family metal-dependent hydrolase